MPKNNYEKKWQKIDSTLKKGGHGHGYRVSPINEVDDNHYFIKLLTNNKDPDRRKRFKQEVIALKKLDHPLIAKVVDDNAEEAGDYLNQLYFVSSYAGDLSLEDSIRLHGTYSLSDAVRTTMSILNTLSYCHSRDIIHRDIKPDNIVINSSGDPVIVDFGQVFDPEIEASILTPAPQHMGNRFLVLPECTTSDGSESDKRDPRSDVTLAAAILLYLLTGIQPNSLLDASGNLPHQRTRTREILKKCGELQFTRVLRIFDKAFQPQIGQRYQSADALRVDLGNLFHVDEPAKVQDLGTVLQKLSMTPDYKVKEKQFGVLHNLGDGLKNAIVQVSQNMLRNQFTVQQIDIARNADSMSCYVEVRHNVQPQIWLKPKFIFRCIGSEITVEASFQGAIVEIFRCRLEDYENNRLFQDSVRQYFDDNVRLAVEKVIY